MQVWTTFVAFVASKQWMPMAILVIGYLVRLTSQQSKFPLNIPTRWQPIVVLALGQVYAVMVSVSGGGAWGPSALHGLEVAIWTMGLFDVVVKAVWNGNTPPWLSVIWGMVQPLIPLPGVNKITAPPAACPKCGEVPTDPELPGPRKSSPLF